MKAAETILGYLTPFIINAYSAWKERSNLYVPQSSLCNWWVISVCLRAGMIEHGQVVMKGSFLCYQIFNDLREAGATHDTLSFLGWECEGLTFS